MSLPSCCLSISDWHSHSKNEQHKLYLGCDMGVWVVDDAWGWCIRRAIDEKSWTGIAYDEDQAKDRCFKAAVAVDMLEQYIRDALDGSED